MKNDVRLNLEENKYFLAVANCFFASEIGMLIYVESGDNNEF